jgi:hypothetical protein
MVIFPDEKQIHAQKNDNQRSDPFILWGRRWNAGSGSGGLPALSLSSIPGFLVG